jgi:hypothetical protein
LANERQTSTSMLLFAKILVNAWGDESLKQPTYVYPSVEVGTPDGEAERLVVVMNDVDEVVVFTEEEEVFEGLAELGDFADVVKLVEEREMLPKRPKS